jgi:hypothetical protein
MIGTAELYKDDGVRLNSDRVFIILCRHGELTRLIIDLTDFRQQGWIVRRLPQSGQQRFGLFICPLFQLVEGGLHFGSVRDSGRCHLWLDGACLEGGTG